MVWRLAKSSQNSPGVVKPVQACNQRNRAAQAARFPFLSVVSEASWLEARNLWLGVGAALERGAVLVAGAIGIVARRRLLGLLGLGAQSGVVLGVGGLSGEHAVAEAGLHVVQSRSVH